MSATILVVRSRRLLVPNLISVAASVAVAGTLVLAGGGAAGARTAADVSHVVDSCAQLQARIAQVPVLRERIRVTIEDLEGEIAEARTATRRTRLAARFEPRIDALRGLDARLVGQVSVVGDRCGGTG